MAERRIGLVAIIAVMANVVVVVALHIGLGGGTLAEVMYRNGANNLLGLKDVVSKRFDPYPEDPILYNDVVLLALNQPFWLVALIVLLFASILLLALLGRRRAFGPSRYCT